MKKAIMIFAVAVIVGSWSWILTRPSPSATPATSPTPTSSVSTSTPQSPTSMSVPDKQSAKRSAEIVLREYFALPPSKSAQNLQPYAVDSLIEELQLRQKEGMLPGLSVKVKSVSVSDTDLPHEDQQIVLASTVKWSVIVDNETTEDNSSYVIVTLVRNEGWQVSGIEEFESSPDEGG